MKNNVARKKFFLNYLFSVYFFFIFGLILIAGIIYYALWLEDHCIEVAGKAVGDNWQQKVEAPDWYDGWTDKGQLPLHRYEELKCRKDFKLLSII